MIRSHALSCAAVRRVLVASVAVLVLGGCSLVSGPGPDEPSATSASPSPSASEPPEPAEARLVVDDGFTTLSTLPDPIATVEHEESGDDPSGTPEVEQRRADLVELRREGDVVRAVVAVLVAEGEERGNYGSMERRSGAGVIRSEVAWRLYDPGAATVGDPLRTSPEGGDCLCSSAARASFPGKVNLLWADFPAPTSKTFTLLLGSSYPPMEDLAVPASSAPLPPESDLLGYVFDGPPARLGQGALAPVVRAVVSRSETASGVTATTDGEQQELALPSDVLFALDSDVVEPGAGAGLDQAAAAVAAVAQDASVTITGHTDDQGGEGYNQDLSLRRAQAVADRVGSTLAAAGLDVQVAGRGEGEPLVPNADGGGEAIPDNQARNRRVAFSWTGDAAVAPAAGTSTVRPALPLAVPATGQGPGGSIADALSTSTYSGRDEVTQGRPPARLDVRSVRREGERVRVDFGVTSLDPEVSWGGNRARFLTADRGGSETLLVTSVLDPSTGVASFALADEDGACLCTRDLYTGYMDEGETRWLWAYYPAPPPGVDTVDLQMGTFGRLADVPLS